MNFLHAHRRSLLVLFSAAFSLLAGCHTNEATGRNQLVTMSREEEIALGTEAAPQLVAEYGGASKSAQLSHYVRQVGQSMVPFTEGDEASLPWEFTLLESDVINAFSLPGGKVFMSRGLLERFTNEAQLAGVLGHEIGHVTAEHVDERISQGNFISTTGSILGGIVGAGGYGSIADLIPTVVGTAGQGYLLKFGRDQESEADALGIRYMVRAGYDPRAMLEVMDILQKASEGDGQPPEFLATHPYPETRIKRIQALLAESYPNVANYSALGKYPDRWQAKAVPYLGK